MKKPVVELTMEELRIRMKAAGLQIAEERMEMVRLFLNSGLAPLKNIDTREIKTLEPAVTFDPGLGSPREK